MKVHGNAALGPAGRLALVQAIESGMTLRAAAAALNVAPATAHRWWHRWLGASEEQRSSGSWLRDRPCTPHRQPRRLSRAEEEPILRARRQTGLGPGRLAGICRRSRSTIWKVLHRHGLSRRPRGERQTSAAMSGLAPAHCCTWTSSALPASRSPATPSPPTAGPQPPVRLGIPARRHRRPLAAGLRRAPPARGRRDQRRDPRAGDRLVRRAGPGSARGGDDRQRDGLPPVPAVFGELLARHGTRHILTPPYTPRWNGKAERFIQTLQREWAYAHQWQSSTERLRSLPSFLRYYNRRRPHSSLGDRPPISRVHNVCG